MQFSGGKSALIFCSTRKGAQEAAQRLSQIAMTFGHSSPFIKSRDQQDRLREASLSCSDKQMQSYILYGGIRSFFSFQYGCSGSMTGGKVAVSNFGYSCRFKVCKLFLLQLDITMVGFL